MRTLKFCWLCSPLFPSILQRPDVAVHSRCDGEIAVTSLIGGRCVDRRNGRPDNVRPDTRVLMLRYHTVAVFRVGRVSCPDLRDAG